MPFDPNRSEDDNYDNPTPDRWDPYKDSEARAEEHFKARVESEVRQKGAYPRR